MGVLADLKGRRVLLVRIFGGAGLAMDFSDHYFTNTGGPLDRAIAFVYEQQASWINAVINTTAHLIFLSCFLYFIIRGGVQYSHNGTKVQINPSNPISYGALPYVGGISGRVSFVHSIKQHKVPLIRSFGLFGLSLDAFDHYLVNMGTPLQRIIAFIYETQPTLWLAAFNVTAHAIFLSAFLYFIFFGVGNGVRSPGPSIVSSPDL